jgi:diacylglycerol kinase family enzyme
MVESSNGSAPANPSTKETLDSQHGIPFVVIPMGTRNHFALELGLDRTDLPRALQAYEDGVDNRIDLAEVNGRVFVNNVSMGVYARIVQLADYWNAKVQTAPPCYPTS